MKKIIMCGFIVFVVLVSANAQSSGPVAWDKDERDMLLGLTLYIRPNIVDIG